MIKFFKKIRQKSLSKNNFVQYLLYAIGEIILVVVGILIALFISNKNQERINKIKITNILKEIQSDLVKNIERSYVIFDYQIYTDSVSKLILNNEYTSEDYKSNNAHVIGYHYRDFSIITNGFDNLKSNFDNIPKEYQPLLPAIKEMYSLNKITIDVYNNRLRERVYKNVDDMYEFDWSLNANNFITGEKEIDYRLNDIHYKKMIVSYMNDRSAIFSLSNNYRLDAINIYHQISKAIKNKDSIPDILKTKTLNLSRYTGKYQLKETSNSTMWDKEISLKIIEEKLSIEPTKNLSQVHLLARDERVFYSYPTNLLVVFDRPKTSQVYISSSYGNSYAVYEHKK